MNFDLISVADRLEMHLPGTRAAGLTIPQLAAQLFAVPVTPIGDAIVDRERRTAIRHVQEAIAALRLRGVPVCAGERGLWRATTSQEALEAYRSLRSRALGQLRTAAAVKRAAFAMQRAEQKVEQTSWLDAA